MTIRARVTKETKKDLISTPTYSVSLLSSPSLFYPQALVSFVCEDAALDQLENSFHTNIYCRALKCILGHTKRNAPRILHYISVRMMVRVVLS